MSTFSSDENTSELANLESMATTLADLAGLPDDAANTENLSQGYLRCA